MKDPLKVWRAYKFYPYRMEQGTVLIGIFLGFDSFESPVMVDIYTDIDYHVSPLDIIIKDPTPVEIAKYRMTGEL